MSAILDHLPCVRTDPAPLRTPSVKRNLDSRAVRFQLERRACQSLRQVLQLKLKQRRSKEELVSPPESSASCHDQGLSLDQTQTEDCLKRTIRKRPESSTLEIHVQEETSAEPLLQARQMQQKRARLADDPNDKISHRPGSGEPIRENIPPVSCSSKQDITEFETVHGGNWSCDEDSSYSLSPEQPVNQESSFLLFPLNSPSAGSVLSSTQISGSTPSLTVTNRIAASPEQRACVTTLSQPSLKPNPDCSAQKEKKPKEDKPKVKKLKYHQYVPPDQRGAKEPPPHLDSSYAKIVQQQQLFLQLQIISQQKQSYHAILPAPAKPQTDQQLSPSSSSDSMTTSSSPPPVSTPSTASSGAPVAGIKRPSLPTNLDEMKVAELKSELKLRSLTVSGTKTDLIERLRSYQEVNGGSNTTSSLTAGGVTGLTTGGAGKSSKTAATTPIINNNKTSDQQPQLQWHQSAHSGSSDNTASSSSTSVSLSSTSPEETSFKCDQTQKTMGSPHTQLSLQACSAAPFPANIKKEQTCSTSAPCQFSLKPACLQKHSPVPSTGSNATDKAPVVTVDKDKMLKEKDKQIEELRRMLRQIQRVVELLRTQLERGKREGQVHEPLVLVRIKQEPPDKPGDPLPLHIPFTRGTSVTKVKQESMEAEEVVSETIVQTPAARGLTQRQEQTHLRVQSEQTITQTKQHSHLQKTHLTVSQQQAAQQQEQRDSQNQKQMLQRKKRSHRELKQQQRQPTSAAEDIYQEPQWNLNQTHLTQELLRHDSTPTVVTNNNGNHFLMALTNHGTGTPESNATNHIQPQEMCLSSDVLFSPVSPASIQTSKSSPQGSGQEEDLTDSVLQTGDPPQDDPNPQSSRSVQPELQTDGKPHICCGRLEDFLESTTGAPLLGVEPGGGLTLIDDLHSQMLCSSSILDHPPSPMDAFDAAAAEGERELDGMDWLDLHVGGIKGEDTVTLDPLGPQTPPSVFSTDFLDSIDLQIHWDSCL